MVGLLPSPALSRFAGAVLVAVALAAAAGAAEPPREPGGSAGRRLLLLPLQDLTGRGEGAAWLTEQLRRRLEARGFELVGDGEVRDFLRERRWRARHALSTAQLRELSEAFRARYVFSGALRAWAESDGAHVALSARITDAVQGRLAWFDSVSLHRAEAPGLLPSLRRRSLEALGGRAVGVLLSSLVVRREDGLRVRGSKHLPRMRLGPDPVVFRRESRRGRWRVAVLPVANRTRDPRAPAVVVDHVLRCLLALPNVDVISPGDVREALVRERIQPLYGVGPDELRRLGQALRADAVLDGVLFVFEEEPGKVPRVDLTLRLREVPTGRVLWMGAMAANGEQTRWAYDIGRCRDADRLAERVVGTLLARWKP